MVPGFAAQRATHVDGPCLRYRLDVLAVSAADVVQSAGGWLFDRARAGWPVSVLAVGAGDAQPLRILGLRTVDLETKPVSEFLSTEDGTGRTLAVSAELFATDVAVREQVFTALDRRLTEVALWGPGWPPAVNRAMTNVQHVLSAAARVFKGYAPAAAGTPCDPVEPTETLLCDLATSLPVDSRPIGLG
ncbi:hypothetical protein [Mycobacterium terramassiliense]|uniref:Uncharacterized protein n=1 Tax=Mycobacterium terramassiliense TaxID=1841859 RepID=A0A2U3N6D8_9MYCO|nr:hypothetical protein [Mycobacterium terramassiliense]SPM27093.1 hypothetical protein MTAB308_568 [Mycobacterium terramassiliense]